MVSYVEQIVKCTYDVGVACVRLVGLFTLVNTVCVCHSIATSSLEALTLPSQQDGKQLDVAPTHSAQRVFRHRQTQGLEAVGDVVIGRVGRGGRRSEVGVRCPRGEVGLQNGARPSGETQVPTAGSAQGKGGGGGSSGRRWWDGARTRGTRQWQLMGPRGGRPRPLQSDVRPQL